MSFHVVIKSHGTDSLIEAPAYFASRDQALEFGCLSVQWLGYYACLEAWRVVESRERPNCIFENGCAVWVSHC